MHIFFSVSLKTFPILLASLVAACSTTTTVVPPVNSLPQAALPKKISTVEDALQLKDDGRTADAANTLVNVYLQSAAADRARYLFDAAQLYLSMQDTSRATGMLVKLKQFAPASAYTTLLSAQLSLLNGNVPIATAQLNDIRLAELNTGGKGVYWSTMAEAQRGSKPASQHGADAASSGSQPNIARAFHAYIKAEEFLTSTQELSANQESIWQLLAAQSVPLLKKIKAQTQDRTEKAWLDLMLISKDAKPGKRVTSLANWRKQYPQHVVLDQRLLDLKQANKAAARHLALILPTKSKELGMSAKAVWEGFKSIQNKTPGPYPIKLYETDEKTGSTINAYNAAVDKGAILIVGPLPRAAVSLLAKRKLLAVPTVALNTIDTDTVPVNLYQFGLPVSHEAKLIARAAREKGFTEAIVLKGSSPLDMRAAEAFAKEWRGLNQTLKFDIPVGDAESIARVTTSSNAASTMLFVAADFHNALPVIKSLPTAWSVFGTSTLNTLSPEAAQLGMNRHIYFVDSPSLIKAASLSAPIPDAIGRNIIASRLYWLGADVCRLSTLLLNEEMRFNRTLMDGATGSLRVTRSRMVERDLQVISFHEANLAKYNTSDFDRLVDLRSKRN